jgi:hypothetical protein
MKRKTADGTQLRVMASALMAEAKNRLVANGELLHYLILKPHAGELHLIAMDSLPPEQRATAALTLEMNVGRRYRWLANIAEVWVKSVRLDDVAELDRLELRPPSTYDDREEAIIVEVKNDLGELVSLIQPYDRDASGKATYPKPAQWQDVGYSGILQTNM